MNKKYSNWLQFIIDNFKPGTATEVSKHIEKEANIQGFKPNNNTKKDTVRRLLPLYTPGAIKSKNRKLIQPIFWQDNKTKCYYIAGDLIANQNILELNNKKNVKTRSDSHETISIQTQKDKSIKHEDLLSLITEYSRQAGYIAEPNKENIDLLLKKDNKYIINEIKTYSNSIYVAVGQVQFYKYKLYKDFTNLKENSISNLNIIGDFKLPERFNGFLKSLNINYINIKEISNYKQLDKKLS